MNIIKQCPRCEIDFMHHPDENNLQRDFSIIDEVGNNEVYSAYVCQECDQTERNFDHISSMVDINTYESYKKEVLELWNSGSINELFEDGLIQVNKDETRENTLSYSVLTESEFNARLVRPLFGEIYIDKIHKNEYNDSYGLNDDDLPF